MLPRLLDNDCVEVRLDNGCTCSYTLPQLIALIAHLEEARKMLGPEPPVRLGSRCVGDCRKHDDDCCW